MNLVVLISLVSLLFDPFVGISLAVTAVVVLGWFYEGRRVLLPAVILGLVTDIVMVRPLGLSSILLVLLATFLMIARRQFEWNSGLIIVLVAVLGEIAVKLVFGDRVFGWSLMGQALATGLAWLMIVRTGMKEGVYLK